MRPGDSLPLATPPALAAAAALVTLPLPAPASLLEPFGLDGSHVTSLGVYGDRLYAGTIDEGVFRRDLSSGPAAWVPLGLTGKRIRAVYPHSSGPLGFTTSAGLEGDPLAPDSALIYCADMDLPPWAESDSGIPRADVNAVWSLDGFPSPAGCGETFAAATGSASGVWRRAFGASEWEHVLDLMLGVGNVVRADPASGNVWAGGETSILHPWIARSTDQGDTWQIAYPDLGGDNACNAIALHPTDPDVAYAGMEGPVIKTGDGGTTWTATGLTGTPAYIYGVALDAGQPSHILAGGTIANPNTWALWESFDAGITWAVVPPPGAAGGSPGILAIRADPARPGTFYVSTWGDGVYRYTSGATGIDLPPRERQLVLRASFPNPFRSDTRIPFEIPRSLDGAQVRLTIHGIRGDLVRVLLDGRRSAGSHLASWDGRDARGRAVPAGVYTSRLVAGGHETTGKITRLPRR